MNRFRRRATASSTANDQSSGGGSRQPRHAIFYDVENKSSPDNVGQVMEQLAMDRVGNETQLVAVGNWRVIGQETARLLASHGAELVHSAPSTGVRDWSDLRIAVDAGIWLGRSKPGDILHIVSDDQAFDAVGDVAATLGVKFTRIAAREKPLVPRGRSTVPPRRPAPPRHRVRVETAPERNDETPAPSRANDKRNASQEEILDFVRRLSATDASDHGTTLDALSNALKDAGFSRPPGSFRLITRLKRMKEIQIGVDGSIALISAQNGDAEAEVAGTEGSGARKRGRRGRRGGRRRGGRGRNGDADTGAPLESPSSD